MGGAGGDGGNNNGNSANGGDNNSGDFSGNGGVAVGDNGNGGDGGDAVGGESHRKLLVMFVSSDQQQNKAVAVAIFPLSRSCNWSYQATTGSVRLCHQLE